MRLGPLILVLAAGCAEAPPGDALAGESSTSTASTGGETPTSGVEPVCGDGVIDGDEACDDGNATPDDGCDACRPAAALLWTRTHAGPTDKADAWNAAAVGLDGRVVLAGHQDEGGMLLAVYSATGEPLWQRVLNEGDTVGDLLAVAVAPDGTIFTGGMTREPYGSVEVLYAFTADGDLMWTFVEAEDDGRFAVLDGIVVDDGALVTAANASYPDSEEGRQVWLRRHDPSTGEPIWTTHFGYWPQEATVGGIALAGGVITVSGGVGNIGSTAYISTFDLDGIRLGFGSSDMKFGVWDAVAAIGSGELVVVGSESWGPSIELRRVVLDDDLIRPDAHAVWSNPYDREAQLYLRSLAVGPGEEVVVAGTAYGPSASMFRYAGDGTPLWSAHYLGAEGLGAQARSVAIGAGLIVVAGAERRAGRPDDASVRVFALQ